MADRVTRNEWTLDGADRPASSPAGTRIDARGQTGSIAHRPLSDRLDPAEQRQRSAESWEEAASGWVRRQQMMRDFAAPASHWMVQAINPQPGETVLELAAGLGETGFLAAELVAPGGEVIVSDQARAMLDGARARARELAVENVRFEEFGAEWIDLPVASVDAVLCRFGYMLMTDPLAALIETRRVLRPGGRVGLAVWDDVGANPWALEPTLELIERGLTQPTDDTGDFQPGPFALGKPGAVAELLARGGFTEVLTDEVELIQRHASFDVFWETMLDMSRSFHDSVIERPETEIADIQRALASRLARFQSDDGTLALPGRAVVAVASA
jgi:SAM-dependent methyltransferase